jgi:tRNA(Ile)-lysidine synthase
VPFFVNHFDTNTIAKIEKKSIEETARNLRYNWFYELLSMHSYDYIATAHHANDNIETVLMNIFRGTGVNGLKGILPKQNKIIRPLLFAKKAEIENYALKHNLAFVIDSTNAENDYTRNYFRNELIPSITKVYPAVEQNMLHNINRWKDMTALYYDKMDEIKSKLIEHKGNEIHIPVLKLSKCKQLNTVLFEILKDYNFTALQLNDAVKLLSSESGKYITSNSHRLLKNRNWFIISPLQTNDETIYIIENVNTEIKIGDNKLSIAEVPIPLHLDTDNNTCYINATEIQFPLLVRKYKSGDYFYPLGMQKKKKLSRFFGDQKLSLVQKENIWLVESNKKIVWIIGYRIDDRFKVSQSKSNAVLKFSITG